MNTIKRLGIPNIATNKLFSNKCNFVYRNRTAEICITTNVSTATRTSYLGGLPQIASSVLQGANSMSVTVSGDFDFRGIRTPRGFKVTNKRA